MRKALDRDAPRDVRSQRLAPAVALLIVHAVAGGLASQASAEPGCEDMRQLCNEAAANVAKCSKQAGGDAHADVCKALIDVKEATCAQAEIICKPVSEEK